jgi:hypothetical protein
MAFAVPRGIDPYFLYLIGIMAQTAGNILPRPVRSGLRSWRAAQDGEEGEGEVNLIEGRCRTTSL